MSHLAGKSSERCELPQRLKALFWEYEFECLTWEEDEDFIIGRVLSAGDWDAVAWLRERVGDGALREWIIRCNCRFLDARRLRFWELVLDLPHQLVDRWVQSAKGSVWDQRVER